MVFCKYCKYLGEDDHRDIKCHYVNNRQSNPRAWYSIEDYNKLVPGDPAVLNRNNNCFFFKERESVIFFRNLK
jgi:hypothetical protein